jgi:hypothetical protein
MKAGLRKRIVRGTAVLAVLGMLVGATSASAGILVGSYPGAITGIEGTGSLGFKGGNMKFTLSRKGKITSFQFSKVRVACSGHVYRTSGHIAPNSRVFRSNGLPVFKFHGQNSFGGVLKVAGIFRGHDHARGFLNFHGTLATNAGIKHGCQTFHQLWSAKHAG